MVYCECIVYIYMDEDLLIIEYIFLNEDGIFIFFEEVEIMEGVIVLLKMLDFIYVVEDMVGNIIYILVVKLLEGYFNKLE